MNEGPEALARLIAEEIAASGPVTVARFMELALAHPGHGYYVTRDPLGARGDFITAPEVSQMFGELIGLWAAVVWEQMGRPDPFVLAELGPGRGTLMVDALRAGRAQAGFVEAARVHLVETSPVLRACQGEALGAHSPSWHAGIADLPSGPAIVIANEFFDALPVRQFQRRGGCWVERRVGLVDGALAFVPGDTPATDPTLPADAPDGAIAERMAVGVPIAAALARRLAKDGGAALVIDYGHDGGRGDTLQAVRRHGYAPVLEAPGAADLTAHVDFAQLRAAAEDAGAACFGPISQGRFLLMLGIAQRAERLCRGRDTETRRRIEAAVRRLIAPSEMGTLFKVTALAAPGLGAPPAFEPYDDDEDALTSP